MAKLLITGGCGFIGSAYVRVAIDRGHTVFNVDKLTYAGNLMSLKDVANHKNHHFKQHDIADVDGTKALIADFMPDAIVHLAAESHVDRSIEAPQQFIETNVMGTFAMLHGALSYWKELTGTRKENFRFHHISTDEVFGSLGAEGFFTEQTPYDPRSPYSASKAGSDMLVRAWFHTYGLPVVISNCSNNYGPYQFPEKLIPHLILRALREDTLPIYGTGDNVRDWIYVEDHVEGLFAVLEKGKPGESYALGGNSERTNNHVARTVCDLLDDMQPRANGAHYADLITHVADRPGHDFRYAIDATKAERTLNWHPTHTFEDGLNKTVQWYLANSWWWQAVLDGGYRTVRLGEDKRSYAS